MTVFEAFHTAGGVLMYGIPEFRLPKSIVQEEIDALKSAGVDIWTNMVIGKTLSLDELFDEGFDAVFIGSGRRPAELSRHPWRRGCWVSCPPTSSSPGST